MPLDRTITHNASRRATKILHANIHFAWAFSVEEELGNGTFVNTDCVVALGVDFENGSKREDSAVARLGHETVVGMRGIVVVTVGIHGFGGTVLVVGIGGVGNSAGGFVGVENVVGVTGEATSDSAIDIRGTGDVAGVGIGVGLGQQAARDVVADASKVALGHGCAVDVGPTSDAGGCGIGSSADDGRSDLVRRTRALKGRDALFQLSGSVRQILEHCLERQDEEPLPLLTVAVTKGMGALVISLVLRSQALEKL